MKNNRRKKPALINTIPSDQLARLVAEMPLRHKELPSALLAEARRLYKTVGKLTCPTFEQWELGFLRDTDPDKELARIAKIEKAYLKYIGTTPHTAAHRHLVYGTLCFITFGGEFANPTPFQRKLRALWDEVAGEVYPIELA